MNGSKSLTLGLRLGILIGIFTVGLSLFGLSTYFVLAKLEVNGPVYKRIALAKDLIADILPPPEYIIESYQVALEIAGNPGIPQEDALKRLNALEEEYNERHAFWARQDMDKAMADALLVASYAPAKAFYQIANDALRPAALANDDAAVRAALGKMKLAYEAHRAAIDTVVKAATLATGAEEAGAREAVTFNTWLLLAIFSGSLITAVAAAYFIVRGLLKELGGEPRNAVSLTRRIASGNLTTVIRLKPGDTSSLLHSISAMQSMLASTVSGIQTAVDSVRNGSEEIASGNMDLSSRTEHHASALEEAAATLENLAGTLQQTASSAAQANTFAQSASAIAVEGSEVMTRVVGMMDAVHACAVRIADITSEIDGIAFQTNILSLNAAVEAARAGTQGAGFAVVASEVRNLAQRSAAASKQIKTLVDESAREVRSGQVLVGEAGATMQQIVHSVHQVTDIIATITEAAREQSAGLAEVNVAVAQMEQVTQQNAALVEEAASAAASLHEQADNLLALASGFSVAAPTMSALPQQPDNAVERLRLTA